MFDKQAVELNTKIEAVSTRTNKIIVEQQDNFNSKIEAQIERTNKLNAKFETPFKISRFQALMIILSFGLIFMAGNALKNKLNEKKFDLIEFDNVIMIFLSKTKLTSRLYRI